MEVPGCVGACVVEVFANQGSVCVDPEEDGIGEHEKHPPPAAEKIIVFKSFSPEMDEEGELDPGPLLEDEDRHDRMLDQSVQCLVTSPTRVDASVPNAQQFLQNP